MTITLYQNSSERNRVDKTNYLNTIGTLNGTLRSQSSVLSLVITIQLDRVPDFNYLYISEFGRYYFVDDIVSIRNNLWDLYLSVDVLMTYRVGILNSKGFIERSESLINNYIIDKKIVVEQGFEVETTEIPSAVFRYSENDDAFSYIVSGLYLTTKYLNT